MKRSRGFTLIELIIVVAIIGIFGSIIVTAVTALFGVAGYRSTSTQAPPSAVSTYNDPVAALQSAGFTSVTVATEPQPSATREQCVRAKGAAYDVSAFNTAKEKVFLVVCCGGGKSPNGCSPFAY